MVRALSLWSEAAKRHRALISVVLVDRTVRLETHSLAVSKPNRGVSRLISQARMSVINLNVPMERITVGANRKMIKVMCWGTGVYAIENVKGEQYYIPHGFKCLTKYEKRAWIAETMVEQNGQPMYRFTDVQTERNGPWWNSPTGALQKANELVCNVYHGKGYNGRIVIGISYPNVQMRIERLILRGILRKSGEPDANAATELAQPPSIIVSQPVVLSHTPVDTDRFEDFALHYDSRSACEAPRRHSLELVFDDWIADLDADVASGSKRQRMDSLSMEIEPLDAGLPCDQYDPCDQYTPCAEFDPVDDSPPVESLVKKSSFYKSASQASFDDFFFPEVVDGVIGVDGPLPVFGSSS